MVRVRVLIAAFGAGAATVLLGLYVGLRTAPGVIMVNDMTAVLVVVADSTLPRFPSGSAVYVKSSIGPILLEKLQPKYPALRLMPFSERPEDEGCAATRDSTPVVRCERDNFVKLEVLSSPTYGTMLVAVGTSKTFGQLLLFKFWGRWRVLVNRSYAV